MPSKPHRNLMIEIIDQYFRSLYLRHFSSQSTQHDADFCSVLIMTLNLKLCLLALLCFNQSSVSSRNQISVPTVISSIIHQQNEADTSRNHQVTTICLASRKLPIFSAIVSEVLENCPQNAVFIHDSFFSIEPWLVHASSIIIVVTDIPDPYQVCAALLHILEKNSWTNQAKFIFVLADLSRTAVGRMFAVPENLGILNAIIVREDKKVEVCTGNQFHRVWGVAENIDIATLFYDQLKDLNRFRYQISIFPQPPKVLVLQKQVVGVEISIMRIIANTQNADLNLSVLPLKQVKNRIFEGLRKRTFHLTLNTGIFEKSLGIYFKSVYTFDMEGYCAVVPYPTRLTFLHFLLNHYDVSTWVALLISIAICAIIWKHLSKYRISNSGFYFVFAIAANFVGQSLRLKSNHRTVTILIQICIFMTFILGSAYQSLIISSMASARYGNRMKTFEELFSSDTKLLVDPVFYRMEQGDGLPDYPTLAANNYALIFQCKLLHYEYNGQTEAEVAKYFYVLPDRMTNLYEKIHLSVNSPFYDDLQRKYFLVFESGIRQYWEKYFESYQTARLRREVEFLQNEDFLLRLSDIYGLFVILGVAYAISSFLFMLEVALRSALKIVRYLRQRRCCYQWLRRIFVRSTG